MSEALRGLGRNIKAAHIAIGALAMLADTYGIVPPRSCPGGTHAPKRERPAPKREHMTARANRQGVKRTKGRRA